MTEDFPHVAPLDSDSFHITNVVRDADPDQHRSPSSDRCTGRLLRMDNKDFSLQYGPQPEQFGYSTHQISSQRSSIGSTINHFAG
jgi:hypothetical protein